MKNLESKGRFFLPDIPKNQVPGFLSFSPRIGSHIDLVGSLTKDSNEKFNRMELINGRIGQKYITLFNNQEIRRETHLGEEDYTKIYSQYAFINLNCTKYSDLRFKRLRSKLLYLNEWLNKSESFKVENRIDGEDVIIRYKNPNSIEIEINEELKFSFVFGYSGLRQGYYMKDIAINQDVYVYLESRKQRSFQFFINNLEYFQNFITLATQSRLYIFDTSFGIKPRGRKNTIEIPILFSQKGYEDKIRNVVPNQFLFDYSDIAQDLSVILKAWFSKKEKFETILSPLFSTYQSTHFGIDEFLNIAKSVESFHREVVSSKKMSQLNRYLDMFERSRQSFNPIFKINSKRRFCERVRDFRNSFTHIKAKTPPRSINLKVLYHLTDKLKIILIANILLELGMNRLKIGEIFRKSFQFGYLKK